MKLTFATKYNGKFYNAGEEIPVADSKVVKNEIKEEKNAETVADVEETADEIAEEKPKKTAKKSK